MWVTGDSCLIICSYLSKNINVFSYHRHKLLGVAYLLNYVFLDHNVKILVIAAIADGEGLPNHSRKPFIKFACLYLTLMELEDCARVFLCIKHVKSQYRPYAMENAVV